MTVVTRKFSARPQRTASETWAAIINAIALDETVQNILNNISGLASSIIADETPESNSITVIGSGPRLRIYCIYGEDAVTGENSESKISWNIFETDWQIHFPVKKDDLEWTNKALQKKGTNFFAYEIGEKIGSTNENTSNDSNQITINISKLKELNG